jgi:glucose uptake protein
MAGPKWRFELFSFDFALGALIATLLAAFTFGTLGLDGFTVLDDLGLAGKRQEAFALAAGCIFNLGNLLLVAAISLSGMSVALPVGLGVAIIVTSILGAFTHSSGGGIMLWVGCVAVLIAIIFDIVAWKKFRAFKVAEASAAAAALAAEQGVQGKTAAQGKPPQARAKKPKKKPTTNKSLVLAVLGGILLGSFFPLVGMAEDGENGVGPYTFVLLFGVAIAFSTFAYNLFFMNLPVQGNPVEMREYFTGAAKQHFTGILGGLIWGVGAVAAFVAGKTDASAAVAPATATALRYGVPVVGAVWGLAAWKEFPGSEKSIRVLLGAMFVAFVIGIAVVSLAPVYGVH